MSAHPDRERVVRELGDREARLNGLLRQGGRRILFGRGSAVVDEESARRDVKRLSIQLRCLGRCVTAF